jgi:predicted nuclease of predicted toxin-antitoxin system
LRFLLDACVPKRVADSLRASGHDAVHLLELGLSQLSDREVFARALAERRIILTFDLDFGEIVALSGSPSAGVIVFRLENTSTTHVIERLRAVLAVAQTMFEQGAIVSVEETRHRTRLFPGEGEEPQG